MSIDTSAKLHDLVDGFDNGMLVTKDLSGDLQARPMNIAEHDTASGEIIFSSSIRTDKIEEMRKSPQVCVAFQSSTRYVSLTGSVTIDQDREKIRELWNKSWELWYPEGAEQPDICLIRFSPVVGEYWDLSGTEGLTFAWNAAKALASGEGMISKGDAARHAETTA